MALAKAIKRSRVTRAIGSGFNVGRSLDWPVIWVVLSTVVLAILSGLFVGLGAGLIVVAIVAALVGLTLAATDYRFGVWLLVLFLPFSETTLLPRQMFGVTGLSPFNILFVFTAGTMILTKAFSRKSSMEFTGIPSILWIYIGAFVASAIHGSFYSHIGIAALLTGSFDGNLSARAYLQIILTKPLLILIISYLTCISIRNKKGGMGIFWSIALAVTILLIVEILGIALSGFSLTTLSGAHARGFLDWTGLHANQIGLFFTMGFALLLFSSQGDERKLRAFVLLCLAGATAVGAALTFSRAAFLGLMLVGGYFLISRRQISAAIIGLIVIIALALALPNAFMERATTGVTHGSSDELSSGRIENIWLPLLPEVMDSPLIGHGQRFIIWSKQALRGEIVGGVGHAHSAYLETLLDMGLLGLIIVGLTFRFMWKTFRELKNTHPVGLWRGYFEGASVCILILLLQGMTGEEFVPSISQSYLWISLGLALGFHETFKDALTPAKSHGLGGSPIAAKMGMKSDYSHSP